MSCYWPLVMYRSKAGPMTMQLSQAATGIRYKVPCGECVGCRLERARQWSIRIVQELRLHQESAFLTLTYNDKSLPGNGSLDRRCLQLFMKRLRKQRATGLRFFACGEYGELTKRPHYHVLLLNTSFGDKVFWKTSGEHSLYVSAELSGLWELGDHYIGDVNFQSASYVAGYCVKKLKSSVLDGREPEFVVMSRRPGIGYEWFMRYGADAFKHDAVVADGRVQGSLPRYYVDKFVEYGWDVERLKIKRRRSVDKSDNTKERLRVRERVAELNLARFQRENM